MPKDACCRAAALCGKTLERPFFTDSEVHLMQVAVCSALGIDSAWALESFELTPYKFNLLESLALRMDDPDVAVCKVLRRGAPTGVREPIPASGVWPPCSGKWGDEVAEACDLFWCTSNHISAEQEPAKVRALVQKEVDLGYLVHIAGGMSAVQQRFPDGSLAIGKLGLVTCAGKEDRLIGDSRASGASPAARFLERAEVPSLFLFTAALNRFAAWRGVAVDPKEWVLFSVDIKGAHKSIRTAAEDVGFSVFSLEGEFYAYVVNHFGAAWSAYWWSRLSALLLRTIHFLVRHRHLGAVYVDDFLFLLPRGAFAMLVVLVLAILQILAVPLSWRKLALGSELTYLGWQLSLHSGFWASLPESKQAKVLRELAWWRLHPRRVPRKKLSQLLGFLLWATQVRLALRAFLAPLFIKLNKPGSRLQCLSLGQLEELAMILGDGLVVQSAAARSDIQKGWRLRAVGGKTVDCVINARRLLQQPRTITGKIWVRFSAWTPCVDLDPVSLSSLHTLQRVLCTNSFSWAGERVAEDAAADAWAGSALSGIGGWFRALESNKLFWFHLEIEQGQLPDLWLWPEKMQAAICALELLAQLALVLARAKVDGNAQLHCARLRQYGDNMPVVAACSKGMSTALPLCFALMALAFAALELQVALELSHVAGERNEEADLLSRLNHPEAKPWPLVMRAKFPEANRVRITLADVLDDLVPPHLSCLVRGRVNEYLQKRLDNPVFHSRLYVNEEEQWLGIKAEKARKPFPLLLFFPVDNSRSSESSKKGLARLRRILDQLALEQDAGWIPTRWAQFYTVIASSDWRPFVTLEELLGVQCGRRSGGVDFKGSALRDQLPGSPAVVLDPQWLLEAMAQVVGCPRVMQKGELSRELLHKLWDKEKFHGQEATLRAFLEHFSLLVPVAGSTLSSPSHWLVPSLLPKRRSGPAQSDQVAQAALFFDFHGALRQLLPSLLPRLFGRLQLKHETLRGKMLCQETLVFDIAK
ncbi:TPR_REGION domain-containing protein [Durusdinium trenchii]|uniref:TPR_REGION domain-containing protein n=1 Tax=Durusdinium trenchii TaxID=1381693 RepID=A0ABP0NE51_9DINO